MQEHGTATVALARSLIMRKHHDRIIEPVIPPKPFVACQVGQGYRPVVVAILGRVAPGIHAPQRLNGKPGLRPGDSVGPEHDPAQPPAAGGRGAVALPLQWLDADTAQAAGYDEIAQPQAAVSRRVIENFEPDCTHASGGLSKLAARP